MVKTSVSLSTIVGVILFIAGLIVLVKAPLAGISLILISLLLMQPVRQFSYSKLKIRIPGLIRQLSVFSLLLVFWFSGPANFFHVSSANVVLSESGSSAKISSFTHSHRLHLNSNRMLLHNGKEEIYVPHGKQVIFTIHDGGEPVFTVLDN